MPEKSRIIFLVINYTKLNMSSSFGPENDVNKGSIMILGQENSTCLSLFWQGEAHKLSGLNGVVLMDFQSKNAQ